MLEKKYVSNNIMKNTGVNLYIPVLKEHYGNGILMYFDIFKEKTEMPIMDNPAASFNS